jgi:hypothetical protein
MLKSGDVVIEVERWGSSVLNLVIKHQQLARKRFLMHQDILVAKRACYTVRLIDGGELERSLQHSMPVRKCQADWT